MLNKISRAIDSIIYQLSGSLKSSLEDYCDLDTVANNNTFICEDGSMVSIVNIKGIKKTILSDGSMLDIAETFYQNTRSFFRNKGYTAQFYFSKNKIESKKMLEDNFKESKKAAKKMGFDLDFFFDEKINKLKNYIVKENCYLVLYTRPAAAKNLSEEIGENKEKNNNVPLFMKAQDTLKVFDKIGVEHKTFVERMTKSLKSIGVDYQILNVLKASNIIKSECDLNRVGDKWQLRTHLKDREKNKPVMKEVEDKSIADNDISYYLYPKLKNQMVPSFIGSNFDSLKINNQYCKSFYINVPQEVPTKFGDLLASIPDDIPFQFSFKIDGGGLKNLGIKRMLSTILSFDATSNNRLIKDSIKYYQELEKVSGVVFSKNGFSFNVYGDTEKEVMENSNIFVSEVSNWGSTNVREELNDPYEMYFNTLPAFTPKIASNTNFILPYEEAVFSLPLSRPLNIENNSPIVYRTEDKKMINYNQMSSLFNYFNEMIVAKPGSGKSVKSNTNNLAFVFQKKKKAEYDHIVPLIFIIDIGPSSKGFIDFLKAIAPKKMKHMFNYHKVENTKSQSINILDTPLGCRLPPEKLNSLILSFLTILTTPIGEKPTDDMILDKLIKRTYKRFSDRGKNVRMVGGEQDIKVMHPYIYRKIKENDISINPKTKWWNLVDAFFEKGDYRTAQLCQIQAVPTLPDLIEVIKSEEDFKESYTKEEINLITRSISESLSLYPMFADRTKLDLNDSRVLSLDLNDVAPDGRGDPSAAKKSALMYSFATIYGLKKFFFEESTYKNAPSIYKKYLLEEYKQAKNIPKRFVVDEYHRGAIIQKFRGEIKRILRESRKWNMSNCLISQNLPDFDKEEMDLCSARFILSSTGSEYKDYVKAFNFDNDIAQVLKTRLTGASSSGLPFVLNYQTKEGEFTQFLYSTLSGMELWASTSTAEDVEMFNAVESIFGVEKSIKILSEEFPSGSIKSVIENDITGKMTSEALVEDIRKKYVNNY